MLWIHKFYENELGYRNGEPGKAGRHIELPDAIAAAIKRNLDTVPIRFKGNTYNLGFQDRPGKECWLNKLSEIDPDKSIFKPGMLGLFFLDSAETSLVLIDSTNAQHADVNRVFEHNKSTTKRYDAVVSSVNYEEVKYAPIDKNFILLPKPFLLLAGISGTGKTRFVREQATASAAHYDIENSDNYCLVPVRPDWHEPSDLLGYISRIGEGGARYVVTGLLCFIVKAWKHSIVSASSAEVKYKPLETICPYWLCLDEMNLAPVEQYFADYLSILETRKWVGDVYTCDPLLQPALIQKQLDRDGQNDLWKQLGIDDEASAGLRAFFTANGIPLPLNLIVAGTVNMDETTHGFSRKVIDRALTIDFGEFFTNDYSQYYEADKKTAPRTLSFPRLSGVHEEASMAAVAADPDGRKTIAFLEKINTVLKDTPFQLAFRALNEILLSVVCFSPADEVHLQAAWDDFLMMKVLPRIEGDSEKLRYDGDGTGLLVRLTDLLKEELSEIVAARPDLLRAAPDGSEVEADCRSLKKLAWMQQRLENNSFTTFWP